MATETFACEGLRVVAGDGQLSLVIQGDSTEVGLDMGSAALVDRLIDALIDGLLQVWPDHPNGRQADEMDTCQEGRP